MANHSIFDDALKKSQFSYLSDFHREYNYRALAPSIESLDANNYSLDEWNEFTSYIIKENVIFNSIEETRNYLLHMLNSAEPDL